MGSVIDLTGMLVARQMNNRCFPILAPSVDGTGGTTCQSRRCHDAKALKGMSELRIYIQLVLSLRFQVTWRRRTQVDEISRSKHRYITRTDQNFKRRLLM